MFYKDNQFILWLTCIVYTSIFVFGLVGNVRVICIATRHKSNRTVVNVFMSNFAVANVFLCSFVVPIFPVTLITNGWPLGEFMCHLWPCIYHSLCYASVLTLTSISIYYRWSIVHLTEDTITKTKSIVIIIFIWSVSTVISLPRGLYRRHSESKHCVSQWSSANDNENYLICTLIIMMVFPLIIIVWCFACNSLKLFYLSTILNVTEIKAHTRTNRLILIMAVVFGICWMPINIVELAPDAYKSRHVLIAIGMVDVLALSWTCLIPLFYAWFNKISIKQFFLLGLCCDRQSNVSNSDEVGLVNTCLPTYDDAVNYNEEVDTTLPTYDEAMAPPPPYDVAITHYAV